MSEGLVGVVEKYLRKGSKLYLEGKLETRKWTDKEGHDNYTTEIVLRPYAGELIRLDDRKSKSGTQTPPDQMNDNSEPDEAEEAQAAEAKSAPAKRRKAGQ